MTFPHLTWAAGQALRLSVIPFLLVIVLVAAGVWS